MDAVDRAIQQSEKQGEAVFLAGSYLHDELNAYIQRIGHYVEYNDLYVDEKGRHPFDLLRRTYWGETAKLRKVVGYLNSHFVGFEEPVSAGGILGTDLDSIREIIEDAVSDYIGTRKNPEGADDEIGNFLQIFDELELSGPVIMRVGRRGLSILQWMTVEYLAGVADLPVIFAVDDDDADSFELGNFVSTEPITVDELFNFLSSKLGIGLTDVSRYYGLWDASRGNGLRNRGKESISLFDADRFAAFLRGIDAETDAVDRAARSIPGHIVAPIMFAPSDGAIGVDHEIAQGLSPSAARGAARALKNQAQDIIASGGLGNCDPGLVPVLLRLTFVAERLEKSASPEEADIVEFGVEFSYFESRVFEARDRIGELTQGEILAFAGEASRYLGRFESWRLYREETTAAGLGAEGAAIAVQLFEKAVLAGILTEEAKRRVVGALADDAESDRAKGEGLARSSENLTSVIGRGALEGLKTAGHDLVKEARKDAAKTVVEKSKAFLVENAPLFLRLAQVRSGKWIEMVTSLFTGPT